MSLGAFLKNIAGGNDIRAPRNVYLERVSEHIQIKMREQNVLKKYCLPAGDLSQLTKVLAMEREGERERWLGMRTSAAARD